MRLVFVESFFGDELSTKVLDLQGVFGFDSLVFFSHDVSPNDVELVKNLGNASLRHFGIESCLELLDLLHSLGWNPLVGISIFLGSSSSGCFVWLDVKGLANVGDALIGQVLSSPHDFGIFEVLVLT